MELQLPALDAIELSSGYASSASSLSVSSNEANAGSPNLPELLQLFQDEEMAANDIPVEKILIPAADNHQQLHAAVQHLAKLVDRVARSHISDKRKTSFHVSTLGFVAGALVGAKVGEIVQGFVCSQPGKPFIEAMGGIFGAVLVFGIVRGRKSNKK